MRACAQCRSCVVSDLDSCPLDGSPLYETEEDPLVGHSFGGYRVEELVGRGGMGSVYRARPRSIDRAFALKVLHADVAAERKLVARFEREVEALSRIRHGNIVSVVDFVTTKAGLCALVMEYLPGVDLNTLIETKGPLSGSRVRSIARDVAAGLEAVHHARLIHRDVKPSNIRIVQEGEEEVAKLLDFGVVRLEDQASSEPNLTAQNHLVGTPRYMAPETVLGQDITPAVDLYALGVLMYEMVMGKPPFDGATAAEVLVQQATGAPAPLPYLDGLEEIIRRLMEKDPAARPENASAVLRLLDAPAPKAAFVPMDLASDLVAPAWSRSSSPGSEGTNAGPPPAPEREERGAATAHTSKPMTAESSPIWRLVFLVALAIMLAGLLLLAWAVRERAEPRGGLPPRVDVRTATRFVEDGLPAAQRPMPGATLWLATRSARADGARTVNLTLARAPH